jgi:putative dimethyl sulfoxide reductase chaperone
LDQTFSAQANGASARSRIFGWLALAFFDPTAELVQELADGAYLATLEEAMLGGGARQPDGECVALEPLRAVHASHTRRDEDAWLHELKVEYARLFIGPGHPAVSPYETIYDSKAKGVRPLLMVSPAAMAVEQAYREANLALSAGLREPPDHFATEAEFLYYLGQKEADSWATGDPAGAAAWQDRGRVFLACHLSCWGPEFCRLVEIESREPFYRAAAHFAAAFLDSGGRPC